MIITESREVEGTIGGGVMELSVVERARMALAQGRFSPQVHTLHHREGAGRDWSGLICAGYQTNLYYLCTPDTDSAPIDKAAHAVQNCEAAELVITEFGVTFSATAESPNMVQSYLEHRPDGWRYVEQLLNLRRVAILGGGHCGLALSRQLHQLGFDVEVFDTRPDLTTMSQNVFADRKHVVTDFADAGGMISYPTHTDVVVMTTDAASDARALMGVLDRPFRFVGAMGSAAKIATIRKTLLAEDITDGLLSRLTAPVGLPIGSNTPEEIAVSVAAQLLQRRSQETASAKKLDVNT
jgi:xanthine dehydrogenase accessory factor